MLQCTRPDTPHKNEWWEEFWEKRADYYDNRYRFEIGTEYWDMRARPVLLNGFPDEEYWEEEVCWRDSPKSFPEIITCQVYYMHWNGMGIFLALQDDNGDDHPDRYIPHKEHDFTEKRASKSALLLKMQERVAKGVISGKVKYTPFEEVKEILKATLNISAFPEPEGYNTIWLSAGIPLDQFEPSPDETICFHVETVIYDASKSSMAIEDSGINIYIPAKLNINWYPLYATYNLANGKYKLVFTVRNSEGSQMGVYANEFQVPPFKGLMSDILVSPLPARNDDSLLWISRQGNIKIMDNPFSIFSREDTVYPYLEFHTDSFTSDSLGKYSYVITLSLYPIEKELKKPKVEMGPLQLFEEGWKIEETKIKDARVRKKGYLIFSSGETSTLPASIFTEPVQIPEEIPTGDYLLAVSVEDANGSTTILGWRRIGIKK